MLLGQIEWQISYVQWPAWIGWIQSQICQGNLVNWACQSHICSVAASQVMLLVARVIECELGELTVTHSQCYCQWNHASGRQWIEWQICYVEWLVDWENSVTHLPGQFSELGVSVTHLQCDCQSDCTSWCQAIECKIGQIVSHAFTVWLPMKWHFWLPGQIEW